MLLSLFSPEWRIRTLKDYNKRRRFRIPLLAPSSWPAVLVALDNESPCPGPPVFCKVLPLGVVTVIKVASESSAVHSIQYPTGRKLLNL